VGTVNIHASCVLLASAGKAVGAPEQAGLLLLGESGSGKSDLALRLIERGAVLVADDRVELWVRAGRLFGRAPANLAGLLEVRGAGILRLPYAAEATISLVLALDQPGTHAAAKPRLAEPFRYAPPAELLLPEAARPPMLSLAAFESSAPAKAVLAAAAFHAQFSGELNPLCGFHPL
jgi:serine kinase of HPr protein (carbohydrate metabolism regulator)